MDDDGNRVIGKVFGGMGNNHLSYHFFWVLKEVEAFVACRRGSRAPLLVLAFIALVKCGLSDLFRKQ